LKIKSLTLIIKHNEPKTINQNQSKTMKKLLLFTLIIGLFAGCKKDTTPADPCYVGTWEGSIVNPIEAADAASFYDGIPTVTLYDNNTGIARFSVSKTSVTSSELRGYKVGIGFNYRISADNKIVATNVISATLTIGSNEPVVQDPNIVSVYGFYLKVNTPFLISCQGNKLTIKPTVDGSDSFLRYTDWTRK
jgi:hypothetical protein